MNAGHAPSIPLLHTPPQVCELGRQRNIRLPLPLPRSHQRLTTCSHGHNLPAEASMVTVETAKSTHFCDSFHTAVDEIAKGISSSISAAGHCANWDTLCRDVALDPLLVWYLGPVHILNNFVSRYRTGSIAPSVCQVWYITVEDAMRWIIQALAALGNRDPCFTSEW